LDHGADIDSQDSKRWTPLMIAAMNANYEVVKTLTKDGANKGIEDI
jgi:ankyrin repeat protein